MDKNLKLLLHIAIETATLQHRRVCSHPHPIARVEHEKSGSFDHLLVAVYTAVVESQTQNAAVNRWIADLESQVSRLTLNVCDNRAKDRQGYDQLKIVFNCWSG